MTLFHATKFTNKPHKGTDLNIQKQNELIHENSAASEFCYFLLYFKVQQKRGLSCSHHALAADGRYFWRRWTDCKSISITQRKIRKNISVLRDVDRFRAEREPTSGHSKSAIVNENSKLDWRTARQKTGVVSSYKFPKSIFNCIDNYLYCPISIHFMSSHFFGLLLLDKILVKFNRRM